MAGFFRIVEMLRKSYGKPYAHKSKQRFKKFSKTKNSKKEEERLEMESIANTSLFKLFTDFPLSSKTLRGLNECEYVEPTDIQRESLPFSLSGSDLVGAAKTGSGKTLALIIPVLECLWRSGWSNYCGLGALIISPTRELALQTFTVINHVGKYHDFSCALLIGGTDVDFERNRIGRVNIIICTPGRLLQHMDENEHLSCDQLQILIIDEADRILDMGFSQQMNAIVANLPRDRQTLLFSATQTRNVKDLSRVCTKDPVLVSAHERCVHATPDGLRQSYMVCEEQDKVNIMWSFIVNHKKFKIIIFVSCCKQARFLTGAFCHLRPGVPIMGLWGTMNQKKRVDVFQKFENKEAAVMIATDVASRGLDFSGVDWVVQVDCPATAEDYIHRVGRTARMNETGHAVLFLTPSQEEGMITLLDKANIPLKKQIANPTALMDIRPKMQAVLSQFSELNQHAQRGVVAYLRSVYTMRNKKVFDINSVDVTALALSYGLVTVPRVRFLNRNSANAKVMSINFLNKLAPKDHRFAFKDKKDKKAKNEKLYVVITKLAVAKKLLNKKIKVNVKKLFDEDGEVVKVKFVVCIGALLEFSMFC
ncbi:unnamed protein product [Angiostrongylus costaricensis]|uniref:ATP-dependent RNA helicase n=1 Tax=Angiostrongylus costaricensis TaxID=334426 RepID=A0A158PIM5_ANGCS|nr:unnamed protein product [Angiostrongylus costaricensis]